MKKIALLLAGLAIGQIAMAQVPVTGSTLTYTQDFNTLDTSGTGSTNLPLGWGIYEWGGTSAINSNYRAGTGSSNTGDTYSFGAAASTERSLGSVASAGIAKINYGVKFANNTGAAISSLNIAFKEEQWRAGDTTSTNYDSVRLYYAINADITDTTFTNWTEIPAALMTSIITQATSTSGNALNGNTTFAVKNATVPVNVPAGSSITLRWYDFNSLGSDDGLSVDSLTVVFTTSGASSLRPSVVALSPANNANSVAAGSNLQITFDRNITANVAGNIRIKNVTDQTTTTKSATSADVTINGKVVTVANTGIIANKQYFVTFDSAAFDTAGYKSYGIYDSTQWHFSTVSVVNALNETFTGCTNGNMLGSFTQQSVIGTNTWRCSKFGNTDTFAVYMNGGTATKTFGNEDWLISPRIDVSAWSAAYLHFYNKNRYTHGYTTKQVLISTNYTGAGNPNSATWTNLNVTLPVDSNTWTAVNNTNLTSYKSQNFFIAYKYVTPEDTTVGHAEEWNLDDIRLSQNPVSVFEVTKSNLNFTVLNNPSYNQSCVLNVELPAAQKLTADMVDMSGRIIARYMIEGKPGLNNYPLTFNAIPGMYFIRIYNEQLHGVRKLVVE